MAVTVLKTPVRAPRANAFYERVSATIRRECLDWMIPFNEVTERKRDRSRTTGHRAVRGAVGRIGGAPTPMPKPLIGATATGAASVPPRFST